MPVTRSAPTRQDHVSRKAFFQLMYENAPTWQVNVLFVYLTLLRKIYILAIWRTYLQLVNEKTLIVLDSNKKGGD